MIQLCNLGLYGDFEQCENGILQAINTNFKLLDQLVQSSVINIVSELPDEPNDCDRYILTTDNKYYYYEDGEWNSIDAQEGFGVYNQADNFLYYFDGTSWVGIPAASITFDNSGTDLSSTNLQAAIIELNSKINALSNASSRIVKWDDLNGDSIDRPQMVKLLAFECFEFPENSKGLLGLENSFRVPANYFSGQLVLSTKAITQATTGNISFNINVTLFRGSSGSPVAFESFVSPTIVAPVVGSIVDIITNLTDAVGEISGNAIAPGDILNIQLISSTTGTNANNTYSESVFLINNTSEVSFV